MKKESGQVLVLAIIVVGLVLVNSLAIIGGALLFFQNTNYSVQSTQAVDLAEAGIDKAIASLNSSGGIYNGEVETALGNGTYSVTVTNKDALTKIIQSTGYIPNKTNPKVRRTVQVQVSNGAGISFIYGLLAGNGGITMGNVSTINGSVYSNGNIVGGNNETITGDVYVAGGTQTTADQQNDCSGVNCVDFIFGKNVSGNNILSVAQSFQPSSTSVLNKVSLKLKKVGAPANPTVRIMADSNGHPDRGTILTDGILPANLVTDQYGFAELTFTSTPSLTADTTYWMMITAQALDNSNYWSWATDSAQSYTLGVAKWSSDWQLNNPVWNIITGDLGFKTWMGGVASSISMGNGSVVGGNVHANTINNLTINKDAYYQTITSSTVKGASYPGSADPPPVVFPISAANIADWESQAQDAGVTTGDVTSCQARLGPGKIIGNINIANQCTIIVTTPLWVTGGISVGNNVIFQMDPSLGATSGIIIVGGKTVFQNTDNLLGTGVAGSYLTLLSVYNSQIPGDYAIDTGNSSITGILYAPYGILTLANNATFKEAMAWQINMGAGTILTYDSGLISTFFSAGPGGSFTILKGTYQVK